MRNLIGGMVLISLSFVLWRVAAPSARRLLDHGAPVQSAASSHASRVQNASAARPLRVLFVGNSHTLFNDMPHMIARLAEAARDQRRFDYTVEAVNGATLADHLAGTAVRERLGGSSWDYVVLQEQQQRPTFTFNAEQIDREFYAPARTLDVLARAAMAKTVLYMTWARRDGDVDNVLGDNYESMQERSRQSHMRLAHELDAMVAPVGLAWRWALHERPTLPLWAADGMHPSLHGSYLAACVLYAVLYARSPLDNEFSAGLPREQAAFLQRAAEVARFL